MKKKIVKPVSSVSIALRDKLLKVAKAAQNHAYAPYSKFQVGAAILLTDGRIFTGCNVENASYGLTICAERNAIFQAVANSAKKPKIVAVAVSTNPPVACSPCGACRQVVWEFGQDAKIYYKGDKGVVERTMRELLIDGFVLD